MIRMREHASSSELRGVPKSRYSAENWYDAWFPTLAPIFRPDVNARMIAGVTGWCCANFSFRTGRAWCDPVERQLEGNAGKHHI